MTRCAGCQGELRNIEGKRHTIERLKAIHKPTCPAGRVRGARADEDEPMTKNEALAELGSAFRMSEVA